jgi:hypothetical protein
MEVGIMKVISTLALSLLVSGMAYAAPMVSSDSTNVSIETAGAGNRNSTATLQEVPCPPDNNPGALPEPASLALLGIGIGAMALRRKKA